MFENVGPDVAIAAITEYLTIDFEDDTFSEQISEQRHRADLLRKMILDIQTETRNADFERRIPDAIPDYRP